MKEQCEICQIIKDYLFQCLNCHIVLCYECIEVDDICPNCNSQNRIINK